MTARRLALIVLGAVVSAGAAGCGGDDTTTPTTVTAVTFPTPFLWGAATAGFQVEAGLDGTDWGVWAKTAGKIKDGSDPNDGPDAFAHVGEDVGDLTAAGMNAYRFSIEMARVYPTREAFDGDAADADGVSKYDGLLAELAKAHVTPLATLHHFVWPSWMSDPAKSDDPQGWERADAVTVFATWCARMGARYGDRVDWWVTINEPNVEATVGYLGGLWPPGVADPGRMATVLRNQVEAHARCYDALHGADRTDAGSGSAARVSIAQHQRVYEPADPESDYDAAAVAHSDYFWNLWILNAIVNGDLDEDFDGAIGPGEKSGDPALSHRADYLGINYYGVSRVSSSGLDLPFVGILPSQFNLGDGRPTNDLGWDIYPEGFGAVLDQAAQYGLPIVVTENGIADAADAQRARFTLEHLFQMGLALQRGVDIQGYFHWALEDNFEWASGFCPRFGLYAVDYADAARTRTPTKVVPLLKSLIASGALDQATIDALPKYAPAAPAICSSF